MAVVGRGAGSSRVNLGKVGGFFAGDIPDPAVHDEYELFAAVFLNLISPSAVVKRDCRGVRRAGR
jgi:hypothetical protein